MHPRWGLRLPCCSPQLHHCARGRAQSWVRLSVTHKSNHVSYVDVMFWCSNDALFFAKCLTSTCQSVSQSTCSQRIIEDTTRPNQSTDSMISMITSITPATQTKHLRPPNRGERGWEALDLLTLFHCVLSSSGRSDLHSPNFLAWQAVQSVRSSGA